ncbi:MAG: MBL fold metallo-hydrolase [Prevotella sp.]|nr:MBL fold metallo-hydrolase [Prevotella sp.]
MKLTFLGTGTSVGVPTIGCDCEVCKSLDKKDKRLRTSALVETSSTRILIDAGPDFRFQMLDKEFRKIDAVLLTHIHYDHVGGMDDLRPFCKFGDIKVYADFQTIEQLKKTMPYCFSLDQYPGIPKITLLQVRPHEKITIGDVEITPIKVMHGKMPILGYRLNDLMYITDMKTIDDEELKYFSNVKTLVVNALRYTPHHSHQSVSEAIDFVKRISPENTFFIHMAHEIGLHEKVNKSLPEGISLAFDNQVIEI